MPVEPVAFDVVAAQVKEVRIETVFRYANVYDRAIATDRIGQGRPQAADIRDLSVRAERRGVRAGGGGPPGDVKLQIKVDGAG